MERGYDPYALKKPPQRPMVVLASTKFSNEITMENICSNKCCKDEGIVYTLSDPLSPRSDVIVDLNKLDF